MYMLSPHPVNNLGESLLKHRAGPYLPCRLDTLVNNKPETRNVNDTALLTFM